MLLVGSLDNDSMLSLVGQTSGGVSVFNRTDRRWRGALQRCLALFVLLIGCGLASVGASAGERTQPIRIGALTDSWGPTPQIVALRDGLRELGYRENDDFVIGVRFTQGDVAGLPKAVRELVQHEVDLIYVSGANAAKAAQMATNQIPIVFSGNVGNPVKLGLVENFARPGGNITGVTDLDLELGPKRLEIFREIVPGLKRVLFPYDPTDVYAVVLAKVYRGAARRLGIVLVEKVIRSEEQAQATLADVRKGDVDGILMPSTPGWNIPGFILEAASRRPIPTMFNGTFWVERGALASYGPDFYESGRQAARLVGKILKGEDPARIPVEANPRIELAINMKVAQALGLAIAPHMLYRADRVIR